MNKMIFAIFWPPLLLALVSLLVTIIFGWLIPVFLQDIAFLEQMLDLSRLTSKPVAAGILFLSIVWIFYQMHELWQWQKGKRPTCHKCGGLVKEKQGKSGSYYQCYGCKSKRDVANQPQ